MDFSSVLSTETVKFPTKKITDVSITNLFEGFITDYHSIINYNFSTDGGKIGFRMINFLIKYFFNIDVTYTIEDVNHEYKLTYNEYMPAEFTVTITKNGQIPKPQITKNINHYLFQLMFNIKFREALLKATCDHLIEELQNYKKNSQKKTKTKKNIISIGIGLQLGMLLCKVIINLIIYLKNILKFLLKKIKKMNMD